MIERAVVRHAAFGLSLTFALATATAAAKPASSDAYIALEVLFAPKWVCTRAPCGGDRPPFRSDRLRSSALTVDAARIITPSGQMNRRHVLHIRVGPPGKLSVLREYRSPEDMVVWTSGRRTFGALTIGGGVLRQAGHQPRRLADARLIQFGERKHEQVTDETLRIGPVRRSAIPAVAGYEMERCWLKMTDDQQRTFEARQRDLGATPPGQTLWAELRAIRSLGRRYGPDGQYLCQLEVTDLGQLRWSTLADD